MLTPLSKIIRYERMSQYLVSAYGCHHYSQRQISLDYYTGRDRKIYENLKFYWDTSSSMINVNLSDFQSLQFM